MKPKLLALTAVVFWSTAASAFKITLRWLTPYQLVLLASIVSAAALWTIVLLRSKRCIEADSSRYTITKSAARGLLNPFLYYLILLNVLLKRSGMKSGMMLTKK